MAPRQVRCSARPSRHLAAVPLAALAQAAAPAAVPPGPAAR